MTEQYPQINCTNCGTPNPTSQQQGNFIDDGLAINVNDLGHYGGFTDNFPPKQGDPLAHLCHNCCVILFNALPGFAKFAGVYHGHGNLNALYVDYVDGRTIQPCCQYAWTWDKTDLKNIITYLATPELTWVKHPEEEVTLTSKHDDPEWIAEKSYGEDF
jgi:hypothetical protein